MRLQEKILLELDHVFCFVGKEFKEEPTIIESGFELNSGRSHEGQGTSNKIIYFEHNYFEFIWAHDEAACEASKVGLGGRARYRETKHCPFGIAFRGEIDDSQKKYFYEYKPKYLPEGNAIYVLHESMAEPSLPFLFVMPCAQSDLEKARPVMRLADKSLMVHKNGGTEIAKVRMAGPKIRWPSPLLPSHYVECKDVQNYKMDLEINGKVAVNQPINNILSLVTLKV